MFTTLRRQIRRVMASPRTSSRRPPSPPIEPRPVLTMTELQTWLEEPNISQVEMAAREELAAKLTTADSSESLVYPGDLTLTKSPLSSLPPGFEVQGGLYLSHCYDMYYLPVGLVVGGDLEILYDRYRAHTIELQNDTSVGGYLGVTDVGISMLPERLVVGSFATFYFCNSLSLKNLPRSVTMGEGFIKVTLCDKVWEEFHPNPDLIHSYGFAQIRLRDSLMLRVSLGCIA